MAIKWIKSHLEAAILLIAVVVLIWLSAIMLFFEMTVMAAFALFSTASILVYLVYKSARYYKLSKASVIMDKEASEWTTAVDQSSEECEKSEKTND
jgi:hypothetical protein